MRRLRQTRIALRPLQAKFGRPARHEWTGDRKWSRLRKTPDFEKLSGLIRSNDFEGLCAAIGWVEVNWALYEDQLTRWCQIMFVTLKWRGMNGKTRECPRSYARKAQFAREGFARLPRLKPFKETGLDIISRADNLVDTRHDLTHAVVTHVKAKRSRYFFMQNRKVQNDGYHVTKNVVFDAQEFPGIAQKIVGLGHDAIHLSGRLVDVFQGQ